MFLRAPLLCLLSLALVTGCDEPDSAPKASTPPPTAEKQPAAAKTGTAGNPRAAKKPKRKTKGQLDAQRRTFSAELEQLNTDIGDVEKLIKAAPTSRLNHERMAAAHLGNIGYSSFLDLSCRALE